MRHRLTFAVGAVVAITFLAGCETASQENFEAMLKSWKGEDIDKLIQAWGPPTRTYPLESGGKVMEFTNSLQGYDPGYSYQVPTFTNQYGNMGLTANSGFSAQGTWSSTTMGMAERTVPGRPIFLLCTTIFRVSSDNKIDGYRYRGNACKI